MLDTIRVHSHNGRILAIVVAATAVMIVGQMALAGQWSDLLRYSGPLGIALLFAWAALWSPYVECAPSGVSLKNVFSNVNLPWPAIRSVDGRFGLTLHTEYGEFTAWSASRPRMRNVSSDREGPRDPATEVTRRWTELQAAGHLDNPRLEPNAHPQRWRMGVIELAVALSVWALATLFLTR